MSGRFPPVFSYDDPRVDPQRLRRISGDDDDLLLVGVVHDHPASIARVQRVLEATRPDVLALELPPAAIELYRTYAGEGSTPPERGGEMSAAIEAASEATVVGIDAPNPSYVGRLFTRLVADRASPTTTRRVVSGLTSATREAIACRLAATLPEAASRAIAPTDRIEYAVDAEDAPQRQVDHERAHVATVQALLASGSGDALRYRDETREACMIDRLEDLRARGDVVAIVGVDHLEALEAGLSYR